MENGEYIMATQKAQRIGIWIIAIVLTIGTLAGFVAIVLEPGNTQKDQAAQQKAYEEQLAEYEKQQKEAAQTNAANSEGFDSYTARTFDPAAATELKVETLVQGSGEVIKASDSINASYFGWTSDGVIFDGSKKKDASDDAPITFSLAGVIKGWTNGLAGVKVGSVVRLTIPADQGYGATGSGIIPPNAPLEFIVKVHKIDNTAATQ